MATLGKNHPQPSNRAMQLMTIPVLNPGLSCLSLRHSGIRRLQSLPCLPLLRTLDLSYNVISEVSSLGPLVSVAPKLVELDLRQNPVTSNLNYLLDLAFLFVGHDPVKVMERGGAVELTDNLREEGVRLHRLGETLGIFLTAIQDFGNGNNWSRVESLSGVQDVVQQLSGIKSSFGLEISQAICFSLKRFLSLQQSKAPICHLHSYVVPGQPREHSESKHPNLLHFYYQWMTQRQALQHKLLQELEVDEELHQRIEQGTATDPLLLLPAIPHKWNQQQTLISQRNHPYPNNTPPKIKSSTPFTSAQTQQSTARQDQQLRQGYYYFGLDLEWAQETQQFVVHRLLSLIQQCRGESASKAVGMGWEPSSPGCFGREKGESVLMSSPMSRNRFLLSSCVAVLEAGVTRVIFNRLVRARTVKEGELASLGLKVKKVQDNLLLFSFRKITQAALYLQCACQRLDRFKIRRILQAWKNLRRRKLRLLRNILHRKHQKEQAYLSVLLAQWRITARTISTQLKLHSASLQLQQGLDKYPYPEQRQSRKLKKSGTVSVLRWPVRRVIG